MSVVHARSDRARESWRRSADAEPTRVTGMVERGRQLGRTLGFPTANVAIAEDALPVLGIYATRTRLPDGRICDGVASIGRNPSVGEVKPRLEVWLFDFDEDIYGQVIETELVAFMRGERKFPDLATLTAQVFADARLARELLDQDPGSFPWSTSQFR